MVKRQKRPPLTPSQKQLEKDVKRLNERINEVAKLLGTESFSYNEWYSTMTLAIPEKYRRTSEAGIIQLVRRRELYEKADEKKIRQAIQRLLGLKTKGQLTKEAKQTLVNEGNRKPTKQEIIERVKVIDLVNKFVSEHEDMFYLPKESPVYDIIHIKTRRKSYDELKQIIDEYNKKKKKGDLVVDPFANLE